jgi:hypothetical protein
MQRYFVALLLMIILQLQGYHAIAENGNVEIYEFLSTTDLSYVRCADHILISNNNECIERSKKDADYKYQLIVKKYGKQIQLIDLLNSYYKYWQESINCILAESKDANAVTNRINSIVHNKQIIADYLTHLLQ